MYAFEFCSGWLSSPLIAAVGVLGQSRCLFGYFDCSFCSGICLLDGSVGFDETLSATINHVAFEIKCSNIIPHQGDPKS